MKFTLGFSPCPNDTFIFDALVNKKIDCGDLAFDVLLEDVQTLNQWAIQGKLDITKLSYAVLPKVLDNYAVLDSGSALGNGVGPLLISSHRPLTGMPGDGCNSEEIANQTIAIPGENTTAHLLLSLAYPDAKKKIFLRYDEIEQFVKDGKGLGVIIHENRFTYEANGLEKIIDLGDFWEKETGCAIPLGGIVIRREIDTALTKKINALIKQSIEFAFTNYPELNDYTRKHAREMNEEVMRKHIGLYVNNYSLELKEAGRNAILKLLSVYEQINGSKIDNSNIFAADAYK